VSFRASNGADYQQALNGVEDAELDGTSPHAAPVESSVETEHPPHAEIREPVAPDVVEIVVEVYQDRGGKEDKAVDAEYGRKSPGSCSANGGVILCSHG
jgi:hypothetical protein